MPRPKRQTLLPWAVSVPGVESKKTQVYHVYPTRAARTCIVCAFSLFGFALEFILRLAFSLFVCIDVILRFSGVTSFLCFLWGLFVLFLFRLCLFALCSARTCILWAFSLFGFGTDLILRFSGVTLFLWGSVSLESINQPINLTCFVLFQNLAPLLEGGLQGRKMEGEQTNTSKKNEIVAGSVRWRQKGVMPVREEVVTGQR